MLSAVVFAAEEPDAQPLVLTLEQSTSRTGKDFEPAYESKRVRVAGRVGEKAFWNGDAWLLSIRDEEDFGLLIQSAAVDLKQFVEGDAIEATGRIVCYRGMPVLMATECKRTASGESAGSRQMTLFESAQGFRYLGLPVEIEGRVTAVSDRPDSEVLVLRDRESMISAVLPKRRRDDEPRLQRFRTGDRVRVTGVVTQDAALPPYDRYFQITLPAADRAVLLESGGMIPAYLLLSAIVGCSLLAMVWWIRDQRLGGFRSAMKVMHGLGEEILAATSLSEILKRIDAVAPGALRVTGVTVYLYDRKSRRLEPARLGSGAEADGMSIDIDHPGDALRAAAAVCYRNQTPVNITDTRRSGLAKGSGDMPRSVLYLPMLSQDEIAGVMRLHSSDTVRYFHSEEQASAQHFANQVAASLKLLEQRSIREQLFKSEKLAATGQLIAGVVNDLRSPVESVLTLSQLMLVRGRSEERELQILAAEAQRTAEIVARLISFGRHGDEVARRVELNALLRDLFKFREREWKSAGIQMQDRMSRDGVFVAGVQGQLEQVFLNILLFAEHAVADTGSKILSVGTSLLGRRVLVDIVFPATDDMADPFALDEDGGGPGSSGLAVLRGIVGSHGGVVRFELIPGQSRGRIEVELPRAQSADGPSPMARRPVAAMTAVILEPDPQAQRTLVSLLSRKGYRAIPVGSADEALDLVQRVKCDLVVCASRMPGFNWPLFHEKIRPHTDEFVLLMESSEIGYVFAAGEGFVLRKPIHEADFERVMNEVAAQFAPQEPPAAMAGD